jgi:hypothetical protein
MKDNALTIIVLLTLFVAIGLASLTFYFYMDEVIKGAFFG